MTSEIAELRVAWPSESSTSHALVLLLLVQPTHEALLVQTDHERLFNATCADPRRRVRITARVTDRCARKAKEGGGGAKVLRQQIQGDTVRWCLRRGRAVDILNRSA